LIPPTLADPLAALAILAVTLAVILRPRTAKGRDTGPADGPSLESDSLPAVLRTLQLIGVAPAEALKGVSINVEDQPVFDLGAILPRGLYRAYDKARDALDTRRLDIGPLMADVLGPIVEGAGRGDPEMCLLLAHIHRHGLGAPRDVDEALRLVRLAAETGHMVAASILGEMLVYGQGTLPEFYEGVVWLRLALPLGADKTRNGLRYARLFRPDLFYGNDNFGGLVTTFLQGDVVAGDEGDGIAGDDGDEGDGVAGVAVDSNAGKPCYTLDELRLDVARDGRPGDLFALGMRLLFGPSEDRDAAEGVAALRQLASRGEDAVATQLARIYREGVPGVPRDEVEADKWALAAKRFREERSSRDASPETSGRRARPEAGRDERPRRPRRPRGKPPLR
jgi:hypothetical protein